jgi:hypothetical protein
MEPFLFEISNSINQAPSRMPVLLYDRTLPALHTHASSADRSPIIVENERHDDVYIYFPHPQYLSMAGSRLVCLAT